MVEFVFTHKVPVSIPEWVAEFDDCMSKMSQITANKFSNNTLLKFEWPWQLGKSNKVIIYTDQGWRLSLLATSSIKVLGKQTRDYNMLISFHDKYTNFNDVYQSH